MKVNQLNKGGSRKVMYVENKEGDIDGAAGRIGWVGFSKSSRTIYYRGRTLKRSGGQGVRGNYYDEGTGEEYWVSGVKVRGSNTHRAERVRVEIDLDAVSEYELIRSRVNT